MRFSTHAGKRWILTDLRFGKWSRRARHKAAHARIEKLQENVRMLSEQRGDRVAATVQEVAELREALEEAAADRDRLVRPSRWCTYRLEGGIDVLCHTIC